MIVRKIFLLILILASLLGCVKDQFFNDDSDTSHRTNILNYPSNNNVLGSWVVMFYEDFENGSIIYKSEVESMGGMDVELKFMDDSTFCGFNTTNDVAGHYIQRDSSINIDVYGGSKVGQPKWGDMFSNIIHAHSIESFKRSNSQLKLYYNNHKNCVTLYPKRRAIVCNWTYSKN
ncbi:MAG: hypothetical protein NTV31_04415 [Bacteroidia bacterium]|nr:hypothetical protein [Bacteroidia bacterium]